MGVAAGMRGLVLTCCWGVIAGWVTAFCFPAEAGAGEKLDVEGFVDPIIVQLPDNYDPEQSWPVLYYWHGPSGGPTTRVVTPACGGRDWIIVGMAYTRKELLKIEEERIAAEAAVFNRARALIEGKYSVDPKRVFAGGYFTGGWLAAELLSRESSLAGALLIGCGFMEPQRPPSGPLVRGKPVYIGVGSVYTNHLMALRAVKRFKAAGAAPTWDAWDFLGRAVPKDFERYPGMRQWMKLRSGRGEPEALREEARAWAQARLKEIDGMGSPGERFLALQRFKELPYVRLFEGVVAGAVEQRIHALSQTTEGGREVTVWRAYESLLQAELRDRSVVALRKYLADYRELIERYPDTVTAKLARGESDRLVAVLGQ